MYPYMFNGFQPQMPQMQAAQYIPQQQIIQANGKASIDAIKLPPNSSVLVMDTSAPMVWMCVSDGIGVVTATPYDITLHKDAVKEEEEKLTQKIAEIEAKIEEMERKYNDKSNVTTTTTNQAVNRYDESRRQSAGYAQQYNNEQPQYEERDGLREW